MREREDAAAARERFDFGFDHFENGAMSQHELVGIGCAEQFLGPTLEAALDAFFNAGEKVHCSISPSLTAAFTISAAAGAAAVPPYTPFSTNTEKAIRCAAVPYGAKPMNHACEAASCNSAVPVLPAMGTLVAAARRPVPPVTTSRMNFASVCA